MTETPANNKVFVFSFDPGDKNNGFCFISHDRETKLTDVKIMKILNPVELRSMLKVIWGLAEDPNVKCVFVVENFRIDTKIREAKFQWNEVLTVRAIGWVELTAEWTNSKLVIQEPNEVWPSARKWSPVPLPKGHPPDDKSALLHGLHFMMKAKLISTPDSVTIFGQETIG